jgi:hypothetical protein
MRSDSVKRSVANDNQPFGPIPIVLVVSRSDHRNSVVLVTQLVFRDNRPMDPSPGPWVLETHRYGLANGVC